MSINDDLANWLHAYGKADFKIRHIEQLAHLLTELLSTSIKNVTEFRKAQD